MLAGALNVQLWPSKDSVCHPSTPLSADPLCMQMIIGVHTGDVVLFSLHRLLGTNTTLKIQLRWRVWMLWAVRMCVTGSDRRLCLCECVLQCETCWWIFFFAGFNSNVPFVSPVQTSMNVFWLTLMTPLTRPLAPVITPTSQAAVRRIAILSETRQLRVALLPRLPQATVWPPARPPPSLLPPLRPVPTRPPPVRPGPSFSMPPPPAQLPLAHLLVVRQPPTQPLPTRPPPLRLAAKFPPPVRHLI